MPTSRTTSVVCIPSILTATLVSAAILVSSGSARAQSASTTTGAAADAEGAPPHAMTLEEAIAYARAHQPAVAAAKARIEAARVDAQVPRAQWDFTFGATAQLLGATANNTSASYTTVQPVDLPRIGGTKAVANAKSWSPYASTLVALGAGKEVFDFGRIAAQAAASDALIDVAQTRADADIITLDANVKEAFYAVLAAKGVLKASESAFERTKGHRDLAKAGVDSGLRPPIELTRAEADLVRFDVGRIRAKGALRLSQGVFAAAVGVPDLLLDTSGGEQTMESTPTLRQALDLASAKDPYLREAMAHLKAQEQQTRAVGAESRPDLIATATLSGRAGGAAPSSGPSVDYGGWVPYVPNWDVGVVFSWPLYDPVVEARQRASQAQEQVARTEIGVVRQQQIAAVEQAYSALEVARDMLPALSRARDAALANEAQADARFKAGLGTSVELADAEGLRTEAEVQLALGTFEVSRARAVLGRVLGEGL